MREEEPSFSEEKEAKRLSGMGAAVKGLAVAGFTFRQRGR
jgi:hypothetical protein